MKSSAVIDITTSLLLLLFSYTAISKLLDTGSFSMVLRQVPLLERGAAVAATLVPFCELAIVLLLLFPRTRLWGMYASLGMLSVFTVYLVYMVLFEPHLPCSCGGVISSMSWKAHIGFNAVLIALTAMSIRTVRRERVLIDVNR